MSELPMLAEATLLGFMALLLWAGYSDLRSFTILNRVCLGIALLYPAFVMASDQSVNWCGALLLAGGLLVAGFVLFSFRLIGGGDAKLFAAVALWAGPGLILPFAFVTAFAGGAMAMGYWLHHRMKRAASIGMLFVTPTEEGFSKQPMPYGVAMAIGGFYVAFTIAGIG